MHGDKVRVRGVTTNQKDSSITQLFQEITGVGI